MIDFIDRLLEPVLWFLAEWSLRWALLIVLLAAWLIIVRPRRSATRYLLCLLVLLAGLVLPILPRWGTEFVVARAKPTLHISVPGEPVETARLLESGAQVSSPAAVAA